MIEGFGQCALSVSDPTGLSIQDPAAKTRWTPAVLTMMVTTVVRSPRDILVPLLMPANVLLQGCAVCLRDL